MQPVYSNLGPKIKAREENVALYRNLTGMESIPEDRGYWTLCNLQPDEEGAEIIQMVKAGLITKRQFVGIDLDQEIIFNNRKWHPEATWYAGEWIHVISSSKKFNPGMIYLDSTSFACNKEASRLTVETMMRCPKGTVLLVNVMLNDPRSSKKLDPDVLIEEIKRSVPCLEQWREEVRNYSYSATGHTEMGTFAFYKNL